MADPSSERSEEIERLDVKVRALDKLISLAQGKILKAKTSEEAEEATYEHCFFWVAFDQASGMRFRLLGSEVHAGEMGVWAVESNQELEAITEGDWIEAKNHAQGVIEAAWASPDWTEAMDLDEDFRYRDTVIFKEDSEESNKLLTEFIKNQVNLVPDKTEPYVYPNLDILKAQVAAL